MSNRHIGPLFLLTSGFGVLTLVLLGFLWNDHKTHPYENTSAKPIVRINTTAEFPLGSSSACEPFFQSGARAKLFIAGMDTGLDAAGCRSASASLMLRHIGGNSRLSKEADEAVWNTILGHPLDTIGQPRTLSYNFYQRGADGKELALINGDKEIQLLIFDWWAPGVLLLVLYVWTLIVYLAYCTALLRDPAPADTPLESRTFSLARTQLAWWFAIIFASLMFLWLVTGEVPSLSTQALGLLGISSATTLTSSGVFGDVPSTDGKKGVFLFDLLRDDGNVTIHRFQMVVMTVALGLMFLFKVVTSLQMPEFDASLLTLLGLSAATYLGLKKTPPDSHADAAEAAAAVDADGEEPEGKAQYQPTP